MGRSTSQCAVLYGVLSYGLVMVSADAVMGQAADDDKEQPMTVLAGFARADITPAVGSEIPGGFGKNFSKGVHDPLWVEAAVVRNDAVALALVGVDLCMVPQDVVGAARQKAEELCGIPGANILIAASHTHNGGPVVECFGSESDAEYCGLVAERIAQAVAEAHEKAVPARISVGVGQEGSVGFNRRFHMKDGTIKTHPGKMNPDIVEVAGPIDPDVAVIAAEDTEGQLLGCIVNHALHGTTIGGSLTSADWPYYLRETIRGGVGSDIGVVFLNGACGDVTQVANLDPRPTEFGEAWSRRVGMTVGAEVLKVLARAEFVDAVPLSTTAATVDLPIRDLGESDEELLAREAPEYGLGSGDARNEVYKREVALVRDMKAKSPTVPVEIQAMRIGDAGVVSNSTEFFCQLGLDIKAGSPFAATLVVELANGYNGYAPTEAAFAGGGYETRTARSSYLAPGAGEETVRQSVRLLDELYPEE